MTTPSTPKRRVPALVDIPLPGSYEVLTLQINATLYPRSRESKFVAVLRDPVSQIEVQRSGLDQGPVGMLLPVWDETCSRLYRQMLYMGGLSGQPID